MRSIRRLLGLDAPGAEDRDTETVRRIASELDRMEPAQARYLAAFAYVLARLAHVDLETSEAETREMERLVRELGALSAAQSALVVQIARSRAAAFGGTENYLVTRRFRELSTREQRFDLVRCLFGVAAADDSVSELENQQISQIASEIGLTPSEVTAVRASYRDKLAVLKQRGDR